MPCSTARHTPSSGVRWLPCRVRASCDTALARRAESVVLVGEQASRAAVRDQVADADVVHLACHGQFRPDNPLFSALRLGDGWLTVRDAYDLDLDGTLVTLSACETGASAI